MEPNIPKGPVRGQVLALIRAVPLGRVASPESLAAHLKLPVAQVSAVLARLSEDERQTTPWHRIVAKGGAIGRGPTREAQFARLVREGVSVSPAGIVQDMGRTAIADFLGLPRSSRRGAEGERARDIQPGFEPDVQPAAAPLSRSRGMKDRP